MKASAEKISSNQYKFSFEVEAETFEKATQAAYRKQAGRFNIPGFRKGKAPRQIIEAHYGAGVFYEEAFDEIFPEMFEKACTENNVEPVDRPEIDVQQIGDGQDLTFTATVYVTPDIELGDYLGVEAEKVEFTADQAEVDKEIEQARDKAARLVDVTDRAADKGDTVLIDYSGFDGDTQFEGGTAEDHELELGSGQFIPGFEEQLIGTSAGDNVDVQVTFPEEYHSKDLAGKPVVFHVAVKAVQKKELPELDDEFAKDVSEFDTFEEYRQSIAAQKQKEADERADNAIENAIVDKATSNAKLEIPDAMIVRECNNMLHEMETRMRYSGINMQQFMQYTGQTIEQMRDQYKPEAERRVRTDLVLTAIAAKEGVEPTEDEISDKIDSFAKGSGMTPEELKASFKDGDLEYITKMCKLEKTVALLKENAVLVDKKPEPEAAAEAEAE